jgi:hypothetical protein
MHHGLFLFVCCAVLLTLASCASRHVQHAVALPAGVILPDWAPKTPSAEFVRAAGVLKPMAGENASNLSQQAADARIHLVLVPGWEFFGTLNDDQIQHLLTSKSMNIPYTALTKNQQDKLKSFFDVWRDTMKDAPPDSGMAGDDLLVNLYKAGAKEDLSNVRISLDIRASGIVRFAALIVKANGVVSPPITFVGLGRN